MSSLSYEFSGRPFYDDLARVSWCSLRGPLYVEDLDQRLLEVLVRRCCEDPDGILSEVLA